MRRLKRVQWWWRDRRRIVAVPHRQLVVGGRCFAVSSPDVVAIEDVHNLRASRAELLTSTTRRARIVRRGRKVALYRIDEPVNGRSASGHWIVRDGDGLVLAAIALLPLTDRVLP